MYQVLHETETHQLRREYMRSQGCWWFELVEKSTGLTQILTAKDKGMFDGVSCAKFKKWADAYKVEPIKVYKPLDTESEQA